MEEKYDLVILGGGVAGLTASIYAARYNLKTLIIAKSIGGTTNIVGHIENWPGFIGKGIDLAKNIIEQAKTLGVNFLESEINNVENKNNEFIVHTKDKIIKSRALIIALGMQHRKLEIKGETEFLGKGVSHCATCDGMFFKNKVVAVVGGSDSAAKAALYLSDVAKKVYIIYRKTEMRCEPISFKKIKEKENIEIKYLAQPTEIIGEKKVNGLKINQEINGKTENVLLNVDGVFIEIGATPAVDVIKNIGVQIDEQQFIIIDKECKTNVQGIFAAGDNTNTKFKQMIVSAGEGAISAKSAFDFLKFSK